MDNIPQQQQLNNNCTIYTYNYKPTLYFFFLFEGRFSYINIIYIYKRKNYVIARLKQKPLCILEKGKKARG